KYGKVNYNLVLDLANENKSFENMGGESVLMNLFVFANQFAVYQSYVKLIRDKYILRRIMLFTQRAYAEAASGASSVEELLIQCNKDLDDLMNLTVSESHVYSSPEIMELVTDEYKDRKEKLQNEEPIGLMTGLEKFDNHASGLKNSDLVILAGRPSMGKTAMAIHMAMNIARGNKHVLFFSLEMSALQLGNRMVLNEADIPIREFNGGNLFSKDEQCLMETADHIAKRSITIADMAQMSMFHIRNVAMRQKRNVGIDVIFVDYLQLIRGKRQGDDNRHMELSAITKALKSLAKELNVPIVLLSQLNRNVESRTDKRPQMSDLRDSGAIEEDADIVGLLYRKSFYDPENKDDHTGELILAKYRNGKTGIVRFTHDGSMRRFE
ncbi:MAG: DnaB-like helicase C-terminal domain-containing protein, partial [Bacteroidales bacterium]